MYTPKRDDGYPSPLHMTVLSTGTPDLSFHGNGILAGIFSKFYNFLETKFEAGEKIKDKRKRRFGVDMTLFPSSKR